MAEKINEEWNKNNVFLPASCLFGITDRKKEKLRLSDKKLSISKEPIIWEKLVHSLTVPKNHTVPSLGSIK